MSRIKQICILGGTGFVGRVLVQCLVTCGYRVTVLSRHPERNRDMLINSGLRIVRADVYNEQVLEKYFRQADAVINLIGILNEFRYQSFRAVHVELPGKVIRVCWRAKIPRLLHMSALNADSGTGTSQYLRTKGEAEDLLHVDAGSDLQVTRFRPSVIFGPGDQFFNRFAILLRRMPWFFPLACSEARFSPVYVHDVAQAFINALEDPETYDGRYDLCGPQEYSLMELVAYTAKVAGLRRRILPLGKLLSRIQAAFMEMVPGKPFTLDNYHSMQVDSICKNNGLQRLGIQPAPLEVIVPGYIGQINQRSRYSIFRRHARRDSQGS